jgi:2-polyprenyl-3-methyl-5-hydroxy-6-metoxy-1,4-benzoquinol methylase
MSSATFHCPICLTTSSAPAEEARVHSNIRAFRSEAFAVWRCPACASLHARDEVDLDHYYSRYPFHTGAVDWRLRVMYRSLLRRLERAGLERNQRILDYGCGGGHFVAYLKECGFEHAVGFDRYTQVFNRPELLEQTYDFVISQDVIEHVADPRALLAEFHALTRPGGSVAIGTPNARGIRLDDPESYLHALHQPYHRHIYSKDALLRAGEPLGWKLVEFYPTMYNNTLFPFINPRFVTRYLACFDNSLDLGFEPIRFSLRLLNPIIVFFALFGYFFPPETDVMAIFRVGSGAQR